MDLEHVACCDAATQALLFEHREFNLDHVEPAPVLGRVVKLQPSEGPASLWGRKSIVEVLRPVRAQVVEYDPNTVCVRIVDVAQITHALGEIVIGALGRDLDVTPRAMGIDEREDVDGAVSPVLVVDARDLTRLRPNRDSRLTQ